MKTGLKDPCVRQKLDAMRNFSLLGALFSFPLLTFAEDFQISVERKKTFIPEKGKQGIELSNLRWRGEIKVENKMRTPSSEMVAKYIVFVDRQKLGQKALGNNLEQVKGEATVPAINKMGAASVSTEEVMLHQARVSHGFYLATGGQAVTNDSITGIWVKLFNGEKEVAEYANPVSLKARFKFE